MQVCLFVRSRNAQLGAAGVEGWVSASLLLFLQSIALELSGAGEIPGVGAAG